MTTATKIPDGLYGLYPQGDCWEAVRVIEGEIVSRETQPDCQDPEIKAAIAAWVEDDPAYPDLPLVQGIALVRLWNKNANPELVATARLSD